MKKQWFYVFLNMLDGDLISVTSVFAVRLLASASLYLLAGLQREINVTQNVHFYKWVLVVYSLTWT